MASITMTHLLTTCLACCATDSGYSGSRRAESRHCRTWPAATMRGRRFFSPSGATALAHQGRTENCHYCHDVSRLRMTAHIASAPSLAVCAKRERVPAAGCTPSRGTRQFVLLFAPFQGRARPTHACGPSLLTSCVRILGLPTRKDLSFWGAVHNPEPMPPGEGEAKCTTNINPDTIRFHRVTTVCSLLSSLAIRSL
jgi:hypothetical protein